MTAMFFSSVVLGSNLKKIDSHVITHDEYEEIPELTDEFFENGIWKIGGNQVSPKVGKAAWRNATLGSETNTVERVR